MFASHCYTYTLRNQIRRGTTLEEMTEQGMRVLLGCCWDFHVLSKRQDQTFKMKYGQEQFRYE